jgi:hypothetical protein
VTKLTDRVSQLEAERDAERARADVDACSLGEGRRLATLAGAHIIELSKERDVATRRIEELEGAVLAALDDPTCPMVLAHLRRVAKGET